MNEAKLTALLMKEQRMPFGLWEVKITKGKSIPFSGFSNEQITVLMRAKHQRYDYKIRDTSLDKMRVDGFTFIKSPSWCICCYPAENRDGYNAYAIDIDVWYQERRTCGRKSLTEERAIELGTLI
jgi:hypothetical protein